MLHTLCSARQKGFGRSQQRRSLNREAVIQAVQQGVCFPCCNQEGRSGKEAPSKTKWCCSGYWTPTPTALRAKELQSQPGVAPIVKGAHTMRACIASSTVSCHAGRHLVFNRPSIHAQEYNPSHGPFASRLISHAPGQPSGSLNAAHNYLQHDNLTSPRHQGWKLSPGLQNISRHSAAMSNLHRFNQCKLLILALTTLIVA